MTKSIKLSNLFNEHHHQLKVIKDKDIAAINIKSIQQNFKTQESFFSKTRGVSRSLDHLIDELEEEHQSIIDLYHQIDDAENATTAMEILNVLFLLIQKHIKKEDLILTEKISNRFSAEQVENFLN